MGFLYGNSSFSYDIPNLANMYKSGRHNLDDMVTKTYAVDQINEGCADMHARNNLRGGIIDEH